MSNGSDINVGSIEEAIEILRNAIRCNEKQFEELGIHILLQDDEEEAIKIVLGNLEILSDMQRSADRELKRQKQINEEHKKINGELREKVKELDTKNDELLKDLYSANCIIADLTDSIPKQKIKNKIEELKETLKHYNEYSKLNLLEKVNVDLIDARIDILQELLQEEAKNEL